MPDTDSLQFLTDNYRSAADRDFTSDAIHSGFHGSSSAVPIYQGNTNIRDGYEGTNSYGRGMQKARGPTSGVVEELVSHLKVAAGRWRLRAVWKP